MPWRALPFARSGKRKQKRICGGSFRRVAKTESSNQRKVGFMPHARRRQFESVILSPSDSKRFTAFYIFSIAVGLAV